MADSDSKQTDIPSEIIEEPGTSGWQERLLPLMSGMLLLLTIFFIVATFVQALEMQQRIADASKEIDPSIASTLRQEASLDPAGELEYARWQTMARLEGHAIHRRYQQASLVLMSRVWIIYLGFVTGMILSLVGAAFILGKIREPTSQFGADSAFWKLSISSTSPGLILAVMGTVLMVTTMVIRAEVDVKDAALYIGPEVHLNYPNAVKKLPPPKELPATGSKGEMDETAAKEAEALRCKAMEQLGKSCN